MMYAYMGYYYYYKAMSMNMVNMVFYVMIVYFNEIFS